MDLRAQALQLGSSLRSPLTLLPYRQLQAELSDLRAQALQLGSSVRSREKEVERLTKAVEEGQADVQAAVEGRQAVERKAKQGELEAAAARAKVRGSEGPGDDHFICDCQLI